MRGAIRALVAALLLTCLAAPRRSVATPIMEGAADIHQLLESNDIEGVRPLLEELAGREPDAPITRYLQGRLAFYEGEYARALEVLEGLRAEAVIPEGDAFLGLVADTVEATRNMTAHRGEHFTLFLNREKDGVLAGRAMQALEASYRNLGEYFGVFPAGPVRVEIYDDPEDFRKASSLSQRDIESSNAIGICKFNRIMVLSPRELIRGYPWMDTLCHEYVHYLLVMLTGNQAPIWVHEGVAKFFERRWDQRETEPLDPAGATLLARALEENTLIPFEAMDPSLVKLESVREVALAFAECATAVDFILERTGARGLRSFLAGIGDLGRERTREALARALGLDFDDFQREWLTHVRNMGLAPTGPMRVEAYRLASGADDEEILLGEISSRAARSHLGLGDTLRLKGRLKPAFIEYKRALREAPESPYVLNKAALAASLLGDGTAALEYLETARRLAPGYPLTYRTLGETHLSSGGFDAAAEAFEAYIRINPFNPNIYRLKGEAYRLAKRLPEAIAEWQTYLELNPEDGEARRLLDAARSDLDAGGK